MVADTILRKPTRHPRVLWSRLHYRWPFLIWLAAAAAVGWLYFYTGRTVGISGAVEVITEEVAPLESARLIKIHVTQGQKVKAGDIIAEFDTSLLDAEMADIKSDLSADQFEFAARSAELQARQEMDQIQIDRQFTFALNEADIRLRALRFQLTIDSNRLDVLRAQIKMFDAVMTPSATDASRLATFAAEAESLARTVALYPAQIQASEADIARIQAQRNEARNFKYQGAVTNTIATHERAAAAKDILAALRKRKDDYVLRAKNDGTVSRISHHVGDVVPAANSVVSIVTSNSRQIIAFVPEALVRTVAADMPVWVTRPMQNDIMRNATVVALGPDVVTLPTRASPLPGQTVRGRRCTLIFSEPSDFLPGESVAIYLSRPWWVEQVAAIKRYFAHN